MIITYKGLIVVVVVVVVGVVVGVGVGVGVVVVYLQSPPVVDPDQLWPYQPLLEPISHPISTSSSHDST